jgi:hypothetical protein
MSSSFTNFKIDQKATFPTGVVYLSCVPKTAFGTRDRQEETKDGTPKWEVQILAMTVDPFGKPANGVLKIGINSHRDPSEGIPMMIPIDLVGFEIGVMDKVVKDKNTGEEKVIGAQVWYRAEAIRPLHATPESPRKAAAAAAS